MVSESNWKNKGTAISVFLALLWMFA